MRKNIDMLNGSVWDKLLMFALPLAATGILQQIFNAADVAVIGNFVGKDAMAAVGSNSAVIGMAVNLFVGIALGTNVVIAGYIGQGNKEKIKTAVHTSLLFSFIGGIVVALIGEAVSRPLLELLSVPDNVFDMALLYLRIYFAGIPVIFVYNFVSAIFRSRGDTRTPLIVLSGSGLINVGLNLFFVIKLHMTVDGVGYATVISNFFSTAALLFILSRRDDELKFDIRKLMIDPHLLAKILRIGIPSGIQGMVFSFSNIIIQSAVNSLGADIMAASSAAFNIEILVYYVINAFGQGCTTFTGQNYGAGKTDRMKRVFKVSILLDAVSTILISSVILVFGRFLIALFNKDAAVIDAGIIRLYFIVGAELINVVIEIVSGALRGRGISFVPAVITLFGVCGVRIMWVFFAFSHFRTFISLMAAYPLSWSVTAVSLFVAYVITVHKEDRRQALIQNGEK